MCLLKPFLSTIFVISIFKVNQFTSLVKWKENKTQEIKVLTAKAMEPQLEEIIRKHKKEKGKLEQKIDRIEIEVTQKLVKEFDTKVKLIVKEMEKEKVSSNY